jgi:hypothetical protein
MKKLVVFLALFFFSAFAKAQCAMCRAVIENSGDNAQAEALNEGITYLMAFPYIIVGGIIYMIYRSTSKREAVES